MRRKQSEPSIADDPPAAGSNLSQASIRRQQSLEKLLFDPPERSVAWIESAARLGVAEAQLLLGQMLLDGTGTRRDQKAAFAWFSVAANTGHPLAVTMVRQCHRNGWGTTADTGNASRPA